MPSGIVLGFDYGTKRIGIAVGQELTGSATPLTTLNCQNELDWNEIDRLVQEWEPELFIVGLPTNADGTANSITTLCKVFGEQLHQRYNIKTQWIDERLTSAEAERLISTQSSHKRSARRRDKGEIDKVAAKLIVETWFSQKNHS